MCGIVGGYDLDITKALQSIVHRGPDAQGIIKIGKLSIGHVRLSIIDLNSRSNQPFIYNNSIISFNGEIWNYKDLRKILVSKGLEFKTDSDTEVLAAWLDTFGVKGVSKVYGMFAFAWVKDGVLRLIRDRFGEVPLHYIPKYPFFFSSELKAAQAINIDPLKMVNVLPGEIIEIDGEKIKSYQYYSIPLTERNPSDNFQKEVRDRLKTSVIERKISSVPVCVLLSGGIDSAICAYYLSKKIKNLVAYTAVYNQKSKDLIAARLVADFLKIELVEVKINAPNKQDISKTIQTIELLFKAQIEIGWACLGLAQRMKEDGFKVTFSGEGSDELWASYAFCYHGSKGKDFRVYRRDLFLDQERKNFIRANKAFMAYGVECRLPFLGVPIVEYAISLNKEDIAFNKNPKAILTEAFRGILPDEIIDRKKMAFQDGTGIKKVSEAIYGNKGSTVSAYRNEYQSIFNKKIKNKLGILI